MSRMIRSLLAGVPAGQLQKKCLQRILGGGVETGSEATDPTTTVTGDDKLRKKARLIFFPETFPNRTGFKQRISFV